MEIYFWKTATGRFSETAGPNEGSGKKGGQESGGRDLEPFFARLHVHSSKYV
jgi:hypothetical protein